MREIVLDVETTGLSAKSGDRIIEFCFIELINVVPTGRELHGYVYPEKLISDNIIKLTKITNELLKKSPLFSHYVEDIVNFLEDSPIIAHNARFDQSFLNHELTRCNHKPIKDECFIDSIALAKKYYPEYGRYNMRDLANKMSIPYQMEKAHSAKYDAYVLSKIYYLINKERCMEQESLFHDKACYDNTKKSFSKKSKDIQYSPLKIKYNKKNILSDKDIQVHKEKIISSMKKDSLWRKLIK